MSTTFGIEHFVTLDELAQRLALPRTWLRGLADTGEIPVVRVGQRRVFDLDSVRAAIAKRVERREPTSG